jgi:hypothetical protein
LDFDFDSRAILKNKASFFSESAEPKVEAAVGAGQRALKHKTIETHPNKPKFPGLAYEAKPKPATPLTTVTVFSFLI